MAPHLAEPRWMMLPVASRPALWKYRTGVALGERLGAAAPQDRHQIWGEAELEAEEPSSIARPFPWPARIGNTSRTMRVSCWPYYEPPRKAGPPSPIM